MIAILNHMPLWAGIAIVCSVVGGVLLGMFMAWLSDR